MAVVGSLQARRTAIIHTWLLLVFYLTCLSSSLLLPKRRMIIRLPTFLSSQSISLTGEHNQTRNADGATINPELASSLLDLLRPPNTTDIHRMSPTDMAYIGDAVYELFVRSRYVWPPKRTADLQQQVVALVRAEHQSRLLTKLKNDFDLTAQEQQILNRGRNAASRNRRDPAAYQDSTALEALIGFVYITDVARCFELMQWMDENLETDQDA